MAILTVGRLGIEIDLPHPSEMSESRSIDSREFMLRGFLRSDSVLLTKYLRNELLEQQGQVVAVTYTLDTHFDAYFLLAESRIESMETSYLRRGLFLFELSLFRIGATPRVEFQSNVTGTVLENEIGLLESEVTPFIAPPAGSTIFSWAVNGLGVFSRSTEDGAINVYTSTGDFDADATWGCLPGDFYGGSAKLYTSDRIRTGLDIPQAPDDWEMGNGLIKVVPGASASEITLSLWDAVSAYESATTWKPYLNGSPLGNFSFVNAVRNDPECVILRLTTGGTLARHTLDLQLRRGSPMLFVNHYWGGAPATLAMRLKTGQAGTSLTPTGATGSCGAYQTSNDADGNRPTIFSPTASISVDTTNTGISVASEHRLNTAIGFEIDGSGAGTGDTADELALQYFGMIGERVRAVWR